MRQSAEKWSRWRRFPDPRARGILKAPFGPGCYELRRADTRQLVLFGTGSNVAYRMSSLLPAAAGGCGTRVNERKRQYVAAHLRGIEYRTLACADGAQARTAERELRARGGGDRYLFRT